MPADQLLFFLVAARRLRACCDFGGFVPADQLLFFFAAARRLRACCDFGGFVPADQLSFWQLHGGFVPAVIRRLCAC